MLNDGILKVYKKVAKKGKGGGHYEVLEFYIEAFYGELSFTVNEHYKAKQTQTNIAKRIRIHEDKSITNMFIVIIGKTQYQVERTYSTVVKGVAVTDITLVKVKDNYDIA